MGEKGCKDEDALTKEYESLATLRDVILVFIDRQKGCCGYDPESLHFVLREIEAQIDAVSKALGIK